MQDIDWNTITLSEVKKLCNSVPYESLIEEDIWGNTFLHKCCQQNVDESVLQYLLEYLRQNDYNITIIATENFTGLEPFWYASKNSNANLVKVMIDFIRTLEPEKTKEIIELLFGFYYPKDACNDLSKSNYSEDITIQLLDIYYRSPKSAIE